MATPISISPSTSASSALPAPLLHLLALRIKADSVLTSTALELELASLTTGPQAALALTTLQETVAESLVWTMKVFRKISGEETARGIYVHAWCLGRLGEFDGTKPEDLPTSLEKSLELYQKAASLMGIPILPELDTVPSVTRPTRRMGKMSSAVVIEQPGWVGELLAEWARTQTTLCFASLLLEDVIIQEEKLAELLDLSCRRNVQALFTPLESSTVSDDPAGTVMGNARLIKEMTSMFPFSSTSHSIWSLRISIATHVADVEFVEASMSANRLVDAASSSASILQSSSTTEGVRNEVRGVLEATVRRLVPFEKKQGTCLLALGKVMLEAVNALYLGRDEAELDERRHRDVSELKDGVECGSGEEEISPVVPENDMVRETRQVFIRAAGLFENAYASFRRTPASVTSPREEQRLLRRLETTYCLLEELDNDTPACLELRGERVDRALWINDRLIALREEGTEEPEESDDEDVETDEEEPYDELSERMARQGIA